MTVLVDEGVDDEELDGGAGLGTLCDGFGAIVADGADADADADDEDEVGMPFAPTNPAILAMKEGRTTKLMRELADGAHEVGMLMLGGVVRRYSSQGGMRTADGGGRGKIVSIRWRSPELRGGRERVCEMRRCLTSVCLSRVLWIRSRMHCGTTVKPTARCDKAASVHDGASEQLFKHSQILDGPKI